MADHDDSIFVTLANQLFEVLFSVLKVLFHDEWFISYFDNDDHLFCDSKNLVEYSLSEQVIGLFQPLSFVTSLCVLVDLYNESFVFQFKQMDLWQFTFINTLFLDGIYSEVVLFNLFECLIDLFFVPLLDLGLFFFKGISFFLFHFREDNFCFSIKI